MKKLICYGDSNTFGYSPIDASRFDEDTRWTSILQKNLGAEYEVLNEGVCDRTGFVKNLKGDLFSSLKYFPKLISKYDNIDVLILWIGTNDLQFQYNISIEMIENGLENLIKIAKIKAKKIIIIPPVILNEKILKGTFNYQFDETSIIKSKTVGDVYRALANIYNCKYFDINTFVSPSNLDGLHYDEISHKTIADKLTQFIKNNLDLDIN